MTNRLQYNFAHRTIRFSLVLLSLIFSLSSGSFAQKKPSMKVKLNVLPSINITRMDVDLKTLFAEDIAHMNELASAKTAGENPISLDFGFSISAYENIDVLLNFTRPDLSNKNGLYPMRIICGYINDGTTFLKRATITNKNTIEFRLRNNNLLKRSMKLSDPLLLAYAFFLVSHETHSSKNEGHLPVSVITIEYL